MGYTISEKIIKNHLVSGEMIKGSEIGLRIDQTLTQDATGTMAYLQFEAMGCERVKTELSVAYIDLAFVPIEFFEAVCHFLELPEIAKVFTLPWMPGFAALFTVAAVWFGVRVFVLKHKGLNGVKVATTLVKIIFFWGVFQLLCFTAASAFDDKEEDSVRVHLKHEAKPDGFGKNTKDSKK